jgi:hypothetical protein
MKKMSSFEIPEYVMHEAFDDETVIVNMKRGHYFALRGPSAAVWTGLAQQADMRQLVTSAGGDAAALERLLQLLAREGLINGLAAPESELSPQDWLESTPLAGSVERYTDAEALLLLDPIHDFDSAGWPASGA